MKKSSARKMASSLAFIIVMCILAGCAPLNNNNTPAPSNQATPGTTASQPTPAEQTAKVSTPAPKAVDLSAVTLRFAFGDEKDAYKSQNVTAKVPAYTIKEDLSNVVNLDQFSSLTPGQRALIAKNGFVVAPSESEQLFYVYDDNTYKKIPSFVTTDSVLQVYHMFYDFSLRRIESEALYDAAVKLADNMYAQLIKDAANAKDAEIKQQMLICAGYFAVAKVNLGGKMPADLPADIAQMVTQEIEKIDGAGGKSISPLLGIEADYSMFTVRGHYTRSEVLGKYFRGMMWFGIMPFPLFDTFGQPLLLPTQRALIISLALSNLKDEDGAKLWEKIYSATSFYVGDSDDLSPFVYLQMMQLVFGANPKYDSFADLNLMGVFFESAKNLPMPAIQIKGADTRQFRFMGQRYIADSEMLQSVTDVYDRKMPMGLDVFGIMGSERAAELVKQLDKSATDWKGYDEEFKKAKDKFTSLPEKTWQSNMYYGWLWMLKPLNDKYGEGYPTFMRNQSWLDKSLATSLGSWTELRHDTILYGKQSSGQCGGDEEVPVVQQYVEPNVELYARLEWLTRYSRENLAKRELLPEQVQEKMQTFEELLSFLKECSIKELNNEPLSSEELDSLLTYGGMLEYISSSMVDGPDGSTLSSWFELSSEADRNMALVADVHSADGKYLEEAVGKANEIYVVVPVGDKLYLTRGAMFDYYEFVSDSRLTDEQWQSMKDTPRPKWTESFMEGQAGEVPLPQEPYSTGC